MSRSFPHFMQLCEAAYDKDVMGSSQITRQGEGGRVGRDRRQPVQMTRRVKAVGGGKTEPVVQKPRKDIGQQRSSETRVQQPTQERGSADVRARAAAAAKEERRKAAQARAAAKKKDTKTDSESQDKPKTRDLTKKASELLSTKKKKAEPSPNYEPQKASGMTRAERDRVRNQAKKELYNRKKSELFSQYKEVHGKNPTGKERTRLLGLAHKAVNS